MSCSKFQLSPRMKRKKLVIRQKDKGYRLRTQKSKNGMSVYYRTFHYWKDLRLKYLKECEISSNDIKCQISQISSNGIWIFQRKSWKTEIRTYHLINEVLIPWYKECASANVFPDGPMLKEEAMLIKETLNKDELSTLTASNG